MTRTQPRFGPRAAPLPPQAVPVGAAVRLTLALLYLNLLVLDIPERGLPLYGDPPLWREPIRWRPDPGPLPRRTRRRIRWITRHRYRRLHARNAIAYVQGATSTANANANSHTSGTLGSTPTIGDILIFVLYLRDNGANTRAALAATSAGSGAAFTLLNVKYNDSDGASLGILYRIVASGDGTTATATWTGAGSFTQSSGLGEYSGVNTTTPIDNDGSSVGFANTGFNANAANSNVTTNSANAVQIAVWWNLFNGSTTDTGGATRRLDVSGIDIFDLTVAVAGSSNIHITPGSSWQNTNYSFSLAVAASGPTTGELAAASRQFGGQADLRLPLMRPYHTV